MKINYFSNYLFIKLTFSIYFLSKIYLLDLCYSAIRDSQVTAYLYGNSVWCC